MAEKSEDDLLFREIDEELRQEQWQKLWQAYGNYAIAAVVALVLGVAGYQGWRAWDVSTSQAEGRRFTQALALVAGDQADEALKAFTSIAADSRAGYQLLARFQEARLLARRGDAAGAAAAYRAVAEDGGVDSLYRDLAAILGALQALNTAGADLEALKRRIEPLAADGAPFRWSAREVLALAAEQSGDQAGARKRFTELAAAAGAPQGVRARAQEMLSILGQ
ncbi:MAG: tetratricopeptide repeat protein [Rhodospirillales bacterium]